MAKVLEIPNRGKSVLAPIGRSLIVNQALKVKQKIEARVPLQEIEREKISVIALANAIDSVN